MRYLLDTNAVIAMLRDASSRPALRVKQERAGDVAISAIVAHELFYGAFRSRRADHHVALVDALQFPVIEFDDGSTYREESKQMAEKIRAGKLFEQRQATSVSPS